MLPNISRRVMKAIVSGWQFTKSVQPPKELGLFEAPRPIDFFDGECIDDVAPGELSNSQLRSRFPT